MADSQNVYAFGTGPEEEVDGAHVTRRTSGRVTNPIERFGNPVDWTRRGETANTKRANLVPLTSTPLTSQTSHGPMVGNSRSSFSPTKKSPIKSGTLSVSSAGSVTSRRKRLELQIESTKRMNEIKRRSAEISQRSLELEGEMKMAELVDELELAKLDEEEALDQYLGSDEEANMSFTNNSSGDEEPQFKSELQSQLALHNHNWKSEPQPEGQTRTAHSQMVIPSKTVELPLEGRILSEGSVKTPTATLSSHLYPQNDPFYHHREWLRTPTSGLRQPPEILPTRTEKATTPYWIPTATRLENRNYPGEEVGPDKPQLLAPPRHRVKFAGLQEEKQYKFHFPSQVKTERNQRTEVRQEPESLMTHPTETLRTPFPEPIRCEASAMSQVAKSLEHITDIFRVQAQERERYSEGAKQDGSQTRILLNRSSMLKDLPSFGGEPEEWATFAAAFERTTRSCGFSAEENLARLQRCLKGPAREQVSSLLSIPENVEEIMNTLKQRFGQPRLIIARLVDKAKATPPVKEDKVETWNPYALNLRTLVTTMVNLGNRNHLCNPTLMDEMVEKLPVSYRMQWAKQAHKRGPTVDLEDLSLWASNQALIADSILMYPKAPEVKGVKPKEQPKPQRKAPETLMAVEEEVTAAEDVPPSPKKGNDCSYCGKPGHWALKCRSFREDPLDLKWKNIINKALCLGCLSPHHGLKECKTRRKCTKQNCEYFHHPSLHKDRPCSEQTETHENNPEPTPEQVSTLRGVRHRVLLRIAPVRVKGPAGTTEVYALFDEGFSCTILDQVVADRLGIRGKRDPLRVNMAHGLHHQDSSSQRINFEVSDPRKEKYFEIQAARTIDGLNLTAQTVDVPELRKSWHYLLEKDVHSYRNARPQMIIGQDHYHLIAPREIVEGPPNAPVMTNTKLGWLVHGPTTSYRPRTDNELVFLQVEEPRQDDLHQLVQDHFSIDSLGIRATPPRLSAEDKKAMEILESSTHRKEERFSTGLLWKDKSNPLPESRSMSLNRLKSIERRMDKDQDFALQYEKKMNHFVEKGYARVVDPQELEKAGDKLWYLPHFAVLNPRKPGKFRLVFDYAAQCNRTSLNDALMTGPDFLTPLPGHLFRFRSRRWALSGDIEEMFPQVAINEDDMWSQCFLYRGRDREKEPITFVMVRMMFGSKSSPTSATYVKNRNAEEFAEQYAEAAEAIVNRHYVDNYLDSFDTEAEAALRRGEVYEVHLKGGFRMNNWISNSWRVNESVPPELRTIDVKRWAMASPLPNERILGMIWDPNTDSFTYDLSFYKVEKGILDQTVAPTKTDVLKVVMAVFDPLGLVSHLTIAGKILMQEVWKLKTDWKEEIPTELLDQWRDFLQNLKIISEVTIPRWYLQSEETVKSRQLHLFSDASSKAYATAAYFRTDFGSRVECVLVMAKSRVVPLKPTTLTIPRLELEAALLSTRLAKTIVEGHELPVDSTHFWTDSQIVLKWIQAEPHTFSVFVANRLGQIEENSKAEEWRYVPTKLNSADIATRLTSEVEGDTWFSGPKFLSLPEEEWPHNLSSDVPPELLEIKKSEQVNFIQLTVIQNFCELFSSYGRMLRVTAWILRILSWRKKENKLTGFIKADEISNAKRRLESLAQRESFPEYLDESFPKSQRKNQLVALTPFKDAEGILRAGGRIGKSEDIAWATKHPIILDPHHRYTELLISHLHQQALHQGQETVLNNLRKYYWVPHGRQAVKRAFHACQICKNAKARPNPPNMAALPSFRVSRQDRPFAITGLDYFGPMEVTIGRRHEKRWGALFTCMTTRAVHVELASSLSTDSCIMALRRFIARHTVPTQIFSDNGTNFRGASVELQDALKHLDQSKLADACTQRGIKWSFIPPYTPHMGGCWERLVGSIKTALKAVLKEKAPQEETLRTFLCEAEDILNHHPLTHVPIEAADGDALTPKHFLEVCYDSGREPYFNPAPGNFDEDDFYLRKKWRIAQRMADQFWKRWIKEYLPVLNRQGKWFKEVKPIQVGNLVIIAEDNAPRNHWERAMVVAIHPGTDKVVRVATVRTACGNLYKRPVHKLCILDLEDDGKDDSLPRGSMSSRMLASPSNETSPKHDELDGPQEKPTVTESDLHHEESGRTSQDRMEQSEERKEKRNVAHGSTIIASTESTLAAV